MKKRALCLLIFTIVLSMLGCSQASEPAPAPSVGLEDAWNVYHALSEEDQQLFCQGIREELESQNAIELAKITPNLFGEWRMEIYGNNRLILNEDMTYKYGDQTGTWYVDEDGIHVNLVNGVDHVIYHIFTIFEEDSYVKLLTEDGRCFMRCADYPDAFDVKFATVMRRNTSEFFGAPLYVGIPEPCEQYAADAKLYVLESMAYNNGLIYVGCNNFEMEVIYEMANGTSITHNYTGGPFSFLVPPDGYQSVSVNICSGAAYFVPADYVEEITMENGCRIVRMKNGSVFEEDLYEWELFPEGTYDDFKH